MKRLFVVLLAISCMVFTVAVSEEGMALSHRKQIGDEIKQFSDGTLRLTCYSSSTLKADGKLTYTAKNAFDGDLSTAWVEGVEGSGIGESITVMSNLPILMYGFSIYAGYGKNDDIYYKNDRVEYLSIYADGEWIQSFELRDVQRWQDCTLDDPVVASEFEFMIESVYYGNKYEDTCISEIYLDID